MDRVFYEDGKVVRDGVIDNIKGEPFEASGKVGVSDGSGAL